MPFMNSLLQSLLGTLDSDEREVVSGDLLEAHESPSASVLQVLSLVVRRQLLHWAGWQPWLVLTTVAFPLAVVLAQTARYFSGWSAVGSWIGVVVVKKLQDLPEASDERCVIRDGSVGLKERD